MALQIGDVLRARALIGQAPIAPHSCDHHRRGDIQLIGDDLHRLGEVQGTEIRHGRDLNQALTQIEVAIGETTALGAEHYRHLCVIARHDVGRGGTRTQSRPVDAPTTRAGRIDHFNPGEGCSERVMDRGAQQQISGAHRQRGGFVIGKTCGRDQMQLRQAHGFHGARRATDIARMGGADQHHTHACHERRATSMSFEFGLVHGLALTIG